MEQLGNLFTAMIAVIVGGGSDLMLKPAPVFSTHPELSGIDLAEFQRGGRYFGAYARVAKRLNVSRPLVTYTARGKGTRRVLEALVKEIRRIDSEAPRSAVLSLTVAELSEFKTGKYRGVFSRVARALRMNTQNVWRVGHGEKSERVLCAIRAEMARVDAELAAKNGGAQ
jgi:hypothetical protein